MYCSKCGAVVNEGAVFCANCGQALNWSGSSAAFTQPAGSAAAAAVAQTPVGYAGFWLRFVAYIIDTLILAVPVVIFVAILAALLGVGSTLHNMRREDNPEDVFAAIGFLFICVLLLVVLASGWLYYAISESSSWQGTLGKKALGLYVTDMDGRRLSFGQATGRFFAKIVTNLIPLWIGFIMAGFTAKKQALHDMIAGCLVLRKL